MIKDKFKDRFPEFAHDEIMNNGWEAFIDKEDWLNALSEIDKEVEKEISENGWDLLLDSIANERAKLLSKKYEHFLTDDETKRLELLNERLDMLNPRITKSMLEELSRMADETIVIREDLNQRSLKKQVKRLEKEREELVKKLKAAEAKNLTSLANNLCSDHRDKQAFRPCLACMIENLEKQRQDILEALTDCVNGWKEGNDVVGPMNAAQHIISKYSKG